MGHKINWIVERMFPASGVGKPYRLMLSNPREGSRSRRISVFGHDSLPPREIMRGITNNDDRISRHGSMFRDVGSCPPCSNL